ncbi:Hypothetical_protein [Hexamita inflata]|uniref:Hypothetical_protein n=1 Tax=Hexamita inflata TaxID=28002 RepID=A0ABP1GKM0_9EUKA
MPDAVSLYVRDSVIHISAITESVQNLSIFNCTLLRFSLVPFKNLISINVKSKVERKILNGYLKQRKQSKRNKNGLQLELQNALVQKQIKNENLKIKENRFQIINGTINNLTKGDQ